MQSHFPPRLAARPLAWGMLAAAFAVTSCAPTPGPAMVPSPPPAPAVSAPVPAAPAGPCMMYRELGTASWYGKELQGRKTASGETFDMNGISAAHRTLPLGAAIRVTNLDNYRTITAKVNDRGPYARNRAIELSYGAAKELGFVEMGTARVKIESLEPLRDADGTYTVHVGSFLEQEGALSLKDRLGKKFEAIFIDTAETNLGKFYRVRVGNYSSEEKAERVAAKLTIEGVEPLVLRKD